MSLDEKSCVPCKGGIPPIGPDEAATLVAGLPEWRLDLDSTRLVRDYKFKDFAQALAFVTTISAIAEAEGHHPDICFGWGYATVTLYTHKIKGLHENDFIMAAKFERAFA